MTTIERVIPLVGHLPTSIRDALARRLRELLGLGLISVSGVAAAALMTWSVQDPSLSHATNAQQSLELVLTQPLAGQSPACGSHVASAFALHVTYQPGAIVVKLVTHVKRALYDYSNWRRASCV